MNRKVELIAACCAAVAIGYADRVNPPGEMIAPDFRHCVTQRAFTGIPSLAVAPNGLASFDKGVSWFFRSGATGPKHDRTCDISLQDSVTI